MADKTLDKRYPVICEIRVFDCSSPPDSTTTRFVGPREDWWGVYHRKKPRQLKVTKLTYQESVDEDTRTTGCMKHVGGTSRRSGTMTYCHNSTNMTRYVFDSRSSLSMAATLAKARFTSNSYAETLATSRQTFRMIGNRIGTLASLANAIRARDRVKADKIAARIRGEQYSYENSQDKPISRRFADGWLEYQFGWLPLLSDIYSAVDLYKNRLHEGMRVGRSYTTNGGFSVRSNDSTFKRAERIRKYGPVAKAAIRTRVTNPNLRTLSEMGLLNPLSFAWDMLPYSFVVDWVLPISSILKSLLYDAGLVDDDSYSVTEWGSFRYHNSSCCGPYVAMYERNVSRQPLGTGSLPSIFTNPRDIGLWHIITSTALLRQSIKGGRI